MTLSRQRYSRWRRMPLLLLLLALGFFRHCESMPANRNGAMSEPTATPIPTTTTTTRRIQELGSPGELAWQAWLLVDAQAGAHAGLDSAKLRRITPKSIFIAPARTACADGYRADTMGRCVKNVNIDQEATIDFIVQRLNSIYANRLSAEQAPSLSGSSNGLTKDQKQSSGPFQLNIPFISVPLPSSSFSAENHDRETTIDVDPMELSILVPPKEMKSDRTEESETAEGQETQEASAVAVYKLKNETVPREVPSQDDHAPKIEETVEDRTTLFFDDSSFKPNENSTGFDRNGSDITSRKGDSAYASNDTIGSDANSKDTDSGNTSVDGNKNGSSNTDSNTTNRGSTDSNDTSRNSDSVNTNNYVGGNDTVINGNISNSDMDNIGNNSDFNVHANNSDINDHANTHSNNTDADIGGNCNDNDEDNYGDNEDDINYDDNDDDNDDEDNIDDVVDEANDDANDDNDNKNNDPTRKSITVVPVAEFVDDTNDTSGFSEVVDYEIPVNAKYDKENRARYTFLYETLKMV